MTIARAFLVMDFQTAWSYRLAFLTQHAPVILALVSTRFIASLVGDGAGGALDPYGNDYFSFALIGMALNLIVFPATTVFRASVRSAQTRGTFAPMIATGARPELIVLSSGLYPMVMAAMQLVVITLVVGLAFGADLRAEQLPAALGVLLLTMAAHSGVGLMAASFAVAFKQSEPLTAAFLSASLLLGGVMYPISVLPGWLQAISPLLPMTHALELLRALLIADAEPSELAGHLVALAGFAVLLPLGLFVVQRSVERARRTGSLGQH